MSCVEYEGSATVGYHHYDDLQQHQVQQNGTEEHQYSDSSGDSQPYTCNNSTGYQQEQYSNNAQHQQYANNTERQHYSNNNTEHHRYASNGSESQQSSKRPSSVGIQCSSIPEEYSDCSYDAIVNLHDEEAISPRLIKDMPPEFPTTPTELEPCENCGRTFNPSALERHRNVCRKVATSAKHRQLSRHAVQRKFDSTKQRQEGLDLPSLSKISRDEAKTPRRKSSWREKHQEFLKTIRAAKVSPAGEGESPSTFVPSDYVQCPHCQRHFGPKAADRHIAWCSEHNRYPRGSISGDTDAVNRLKTRTKYIPPKPGQNGWRAPRKKDVISSIPPPNVGANVTPQGRLLSPPPPSQRQASPPPMSPSRRSSGALPPSPYTHHRSNSLGRAAGKHIAAMMQSMGPNSSYYGSPPPMHPSPPHLNPNSPFSRTASLKLPRRRGAGGKMARHRDLASDMMASVSIGGKAKRGEPEGDEGGNMMPYHHSSRRSTDATSYKHQDSPYDPFSAAEMQLEDLLKPSKGRYRNNSGLSDLRCSMMGSTGSLKGIGLRDRDIGDLSPTRIEARSYALSGPGSLSLCSLGLDSLNMNSEDFTKPPPQKRNYFSQLDSPLNSPSVLSPLDESRTFLSNYPTSRMSDSLNKRSSPSREYSESPRDSRSRSLCSQSSRSDYMGESEDSPRRRSDGVSSWTKSPSPTFSVGSAFSSISKNSIKEKSPTAAQRYQRSSLDYKIAENDREFPDKAESYGWTNNSDSFLSSPGSSYSRYLNSSSSRDNSGVGMRISSRRSPPHDSASSKFFDPLQGLRATIEEDLRAQDLFDRLEANNQQQRASSDSSTDSSSLPPVSTSPNPTLILDSSSSQDAFSAANARPKFCYECGNKYPIDMAKFCCNCGARRV